MSSAGINGLLVVLFMKLASIRKNRNLRLIVYLSFTDFLTALLAFPYVLYMVFNWNSIQINFDPLYIIISSLPLPIQLKNSAVLTIGIAFSRNLAIFSPFHFRKLEQTYFPELLLLMGILSGLFDAALCMKLSSPVQKPNCGTSGCFVSDEFRYYWGISNMILGLIVVLLSITIFLKIRNVENHTPGDIPSLHKEHKFQQTNRTNTGVLISSLFFLTIPSVCAGIVEMTGISIFRLVGPFYSASLMSSGVCNGIIFLCCNGYIRRFMANKSRHTPTHTISVAEKAVVVRY